MRFQDVLDAIINSDPETDWFSVGAAFHEAGRSSAKVFIPDIHLRLELDLTMLDPKTQERRQSHIIEPGDEWYQLCRIHYGVTHLMTVSLYANFELKPDAPEGSRARNVGELTTLIPGLRCRPNVCGDPVIPYFDYKIARIYDGTGRLDDFIREKKREIEPPITGAEYLAEIQERRRCADESFRQRWEVRRLEPTEPLPPRRARRFWFPGAGK